MPWKQRELGVHLTYGERVRCGVHLADTASWLPLVTRSPCHCHCSHVHTQGSSFPCRDMGPCYWYSGRDAGGRGSPRKGLWILLPPSATWPFGPVFPGQTDARRGGCAVSLPLQAEGRSGSTPPQCSVHRWHSYSSLTDGFVVRRRVRWLCLVSHSWNVSLEQSRSAPFFSQVGSTALSESSPTSTLGPSLLGPGTQVLSPRHLSCTAHLSHPVCPGCQISFPSDNGETEVLMLPDKWLGDGRGWGRWRQGGSPALPLFPTPADAVIRGSSGNVCFLCLSLDY